MSISCARTIASHFISTRQGPVFIGGPMEEYFLRTMQFDAGLNCFREAARQSEALQKVASMPDGMVFVATHAAEVIGYVTIHPPDEYSRWGRHPGVLELGAIEVSRAWRGQGIGKLILKTLFERSNLENKIIVSTEYHWHWDLEGTGLELQDYRMMLLKLFQSCGFQSRFTDDPDIVSHRANLLMVRTGSEVLKEDAYEFERLLVSRVLF